ncbi:exonuclease SbcCD subunit D [Staphylococcus massiliensis]|uniref:exonuclease subunit SbcD n=1 Tax=Staphylococcus massiliensis TaxID=555791 RepID=UPI001EDD64F6|nr:exonuclease subunit SbcD [Staphylococcus massiliensis]MCG3412613.1 exonuclease SbcCD subunit D [Staphylococcus massiliensis]
MKVIHTADWHIGRILNGRALIQDQTYILHKFVEHMKEIEPDLIVITGDLYDTSFPSKSAIKLLEDTIKQLNISLQIPIIIISGNHDGKERLSYGASWFEQSQLYIRTEIEDLYNPIKIRDVNFYTLPFATLAEFQNYYKDVEINSNHEAMRHAIKDIETSLNSSEKNVLLSHLTVSGGIKTDSERDLTIGTIESVDEDVFKMFDTVLLGHLHHPFSINSDFMYYSGSLLQYSFSEASQSKGFREVTIKQNQDISSKFIPMVPLRELEVIEADYQDVINENVKVKNKENYFHFKLSNMARIEDPIYHIKQIYPNTLALTNDTVYSQHQVAKRNLKQLDSNTIIQQFYEDVMDDELDKLQEQKVRQLVEALDEEERSR